MEGTQAVAGDASHPGTWEADAGRLPSLSQKPHSSNNKAGKKQKAQLVLEAVWHAC